MRFLSHSPKFQVQIIEPRVRFTQYGDRVVDREGYVAVFTPDDVTQADVEFAEREFEKGGLLNGRTVMRDEVTPTPLINRLSVFDTDEQAARENWAGLTYEDPRGNVHDFKTYVENFLAQRAINHGDFRQVTVALIEAPWPTYLQFNGTLDGLLQKIVEDGYDPGRVLAFERQLSPQRPNVIAALEQLAASQQAEMAGREQILA